MTLKLKVKLEEAVQNWIEEICEHDDRPEGYMHPELVIQMTNAAEAVFDSGFAAQAYKELNEEN